MRKPKTDFLKFLTKILFDKLFTRVISVQPKRGPQSSWATSGSKIHMYTHTIICKHKADHVKYLAKGNKVREKRGKWERIWIWKMLAMHKLTNLNYKDGENFKHIVDSLSLLNNLLIQNKSPQ